MTLIAINCQQDSAQILTDTAAYTPNLRHLTARSKVFHLNHLDAALVAGGLPEFGAMVRYVIDADARLSDVTTFDELVNVIPDVLPGVFAANAEGRAEEKSPGVIMLVGYSERSGRFRAYEHGSDDDFQPIPLEGTYLHPTPWHLRPSEREYRLLLQAYEELGAHPDVVANIRDNWLAQPAPDPAITPDALADLARATREDRSMGGGIPIAGDLVHHTIRRGRVVTRTVWTFPSDGPDFARFVEGTDHPVAQAADCPCGSGRNILACCRAEDLSKPCRCHSGALFQDCCLTPEAAVMLFRSAVL